MIALFFSDLCIVIPRQDVEIGSECAGIENILVGRVILRFAEEYVVIQGGILNPGRVSDVRDRTLIEEIQQF